MKIFHISDLHLGKRLNAFSLIEDQEYILHQILRYVDSEEPQVLIIAGDVYDKPVPSAEAVRLFDDFLFALSERHLTVFIDCGNHDSPERIAFASRILGREGVYVSPVYDGTLSAIPLSDTFGTVDFVLLPFLKPAAVRRFFENEVIETYSDAVRTALTAISIEPYHRTVLIAHQFFAGAATCDSEELSVGGTEAVDITVTDAFDYVALGHLHGPQSVGRAALRYCGSPLSYSSSEMRTEKSVTVVELGGKGHTEIRTLRLSPMRQMREIRGSYMEVTARSFYEGTNTQDYIYAVLTDENDIPDAISRLRTIYPNLLSLVYDNIRTRSVSPTWTVNDAQIRQPIELFGNFYRLQNGIDLDAKQTDFLQNLIQEIWEDKE